MQMGNRLAAIASVVDDEAKTAFSEAQTVGDFRRLQKQMAQGLLVLRGRFGHPGNRLLGNDQNMKRSLGIDVPKGVDQLILVKRFSGYLAGDDFLEQSHDGFVLLHQQGAGIARLAALPAGAQVIDNLVVELLAAPAPTARADQLFHATAQPLEMQNLRRLA